MPCILFAHGAVMTFMFRTTLMVFAIGRFAGAGKGKEDVAGEGINSGGGVFGAGFFGRVAGKRVADGEPGAGVMAAGKGRNGGAVEEAGGGG